MIVKTFEGTTMQEAMKKVKKELGPQAVIVSSKEKAIDGGQSKIFELRAAIPEKTKIEGASAATTEATNNSNQLLKARLDSIDTKLATLTRDSIHKSHIQAMDDRIKEIKYLLFESLRAQDTSSILSSLPAYLIPLYQELALAGIDQRLNSDLMNHLISLQPQGSELENFASLSDYYRSMSIRWLAKKIRISTSFSAAKAQSSTHLFVGPTGCGKTTSIIKIAATLKKSQNLNIALATLANVRLGATDALRVFAKIIDAPLLVADSIEDLADKLNTGVQYDALFIDCPGSFPTLNDDIFSLKEKILNNNPIDVHMVLPLSSKLEAIESSITHFAPLGLQSLIFTKLDESLSYGEMLNLSVKWSLPLSFLCHGPRIPDDLTAASREACLSRIFRSNTLDIPSR